MINFQKSGCDVEAHVKRECDSLVSIVEKKKVELLKRVSDEYQEKLAELNDAMQQCEHVLLQGDGLAEFTQEALKEDNPATFLQVSVARVLRKSVNTSGLTKPPVFVELTPKPSTKDNLSTFLVVSVTCALYEFFFKTRR